MSDYQNLKDRKGKRSPDHTSSTTTYPKQVIKTQTRQVQGEGFKETHLRLYLANLSKTCLLLHASVLAALLVNVQKGRNREMQT
jgi:hypothetical protein